MRVTAFILGFALTFALLWGMWPSPIEPHYWDEPEPPEMTGVLAPNDALSAAEIVSLDLIDGGEDLAVAPDGSIYVGTLDGRVQRIFRTQDDADWQVETLARIAGTPVLGVHMIDATTLGVAANSGLYAYDTESGEVSALSTGVPTRPFGFVNDLDVTEDGTIYFTDSSTRWGHASDSPGYFYDMLENRPNGLLYAWDPRSRVTRIAAERLYYPNGVAVSSDGRSVLFTETFRFRIQRLWIAGPRSGEIEIVAENMPGMPDGLSIDGDGRIFVAMLSQRSDLLRFMRRNPFWNLMTVKLPPWLRPTNGGATGFIAVLDENTGEIIGTFHDGDGALDYISSVELAGDDAWFGSTYGEYVGRFSLPASVRPGEPAEPAIAPSLSAHED